MLFLTAFGICIILFFVGLFQESLGYGMVWFSLSFLITMILFASVTSIFFSTTEPYEYEYVDLYGISSLEYKTENHEYTNGVFVLGLGYVESGSVEKSVYYFIADEQHGKRIKSLEEGDGKVYVYEDNTQTPKVQKIYGKYKCNAFWKFIFGFDEQTIETGDIRIVVPENTVKVDYNVSLQS